MAQKLAGRTPRGHELWRDTNSDRWFVREPVREPKALRALNTVRDLHRRVELGRFQSFTEAAAFADAKGVAR